MSKLVYIQSLADPIAKPVRLQRSRRKGSKVASPNGLPVVCVTRPGMWGNPWPTADEFRRRVENGDWLDYLSANFRHNHGPVPDAWSLFIVRKMLRGRNLACWCPLDRDCHASVLLEIANAPETGAPK